MKYTCIERSGMGNTDFQKMFCLPKSLMFGNFTVQKVTNRCNSHITATHILIIFGVRYTDIVY